MAAINYTPIQIYYSSITTNVPLPANLAAGELAINTADGKLFYKDSSNVVQILATKGGVGSSSTTQVLYNSSGLTVGSANLTFNGTVLTSSFAGPVAATTLSASSTVSGTGFSTYLASPPAIGGTAAAAGAFTTLSASSTVSGTGFSTYLASPPAIGGTAAAAGTFTALTVNTSFVSPAPTPASITTSSTLTNANIQAQIITGSSGSITMTMPLGTTLESLVTWSAVNFGYDFTVINLYGLGSISIGSNTGVTIVGSSSIGVNNSAQFRIRRTAANTFVVYRLS